MDKKTLICATGQDSFDLVLRNLENYEIIDTVSYKAELVESCITNNPDIIVVTDNLGGQEYLFKILIRLRVLCPDTRIVYFCGKIDFNDNLRVAGLNCLIAAGIYDIIDESKLDVNMVGYILANPKDRDTLEFLESKYSETIYLNRPSQKIEFTYSSLDEDEMLDDGVWNNLHMFISSKHGVGKSMIVANTAIAISEMGIAKNGSKPKVAIIDLDFENFSISNIFDTLSNDKNIIKAIEQARKAIPNGEMADDASVKHEALDSIKKMLLPTKKNANIKILCGPMASFKEDEFERITENDIVFILETIVNDYDIVLVDTNSDVSYNKIFPLFSMSRNVYSVMEMNLNTFNGESRLRGYIEEFLNTQKLKYILNKEILDSPISSKDIEEQLGYQFLAKIPIVPAEKMFEIDLKKDFLINQREKDYLRHRYEIIKVANDIWPVRNFDELNEKMIALFGGESEIVEEDGYSNPLVGFLMKSLGIDNSDKDAIKTTVSNSKIIAKSKEFSFKDMFNKFGKGIEEIKKDATQKNIESNSDDVKAIEDKSEESDSNDGGTNNE